MNKRPAKVYPRGFILPRPRSKRATLSIVNNPAPPYERPTSRAQCKDGIRPCPYVGCQYHLFLDDAGYGGIKFTYGTDDVAILKTLPTTCALDEADKGGMSQYAVAKLFNVTDAAIQQDLRTIFKKLGCSGDLSKLK